MLWQIRSPFTLIAALLALVAVRPDARAGTCEMPREMKLVWDATHGEGLLVSVAYQCPAPPACASPLPKDSMATKAPLTITVRSGSTAIMSVPMTGCDTGKCTSANTGGCQRGFDSHKAPAGLVRLSYASDGRAAVSVRVRAVMPGGPPDGNGPVTVTVADAGSYTADTTFTRCRVTKNPTNVIMVCR